MMILKITFALIAITQLFAFVNCNFAEKTFAKFVQFKEEKGTQAADNMKWSDVFKFIIPGGDDKQEPSLKKTKPKFCNGLDCPDFEVVATTDDYEERQYVQSGWVSTSMTGIDFKDAQSKMFRKLFNYIQGNNKEEKKIDMTCPVITRLIPGAGPACVSNFTMSFFMSKSVPDPPQPSDQTVFLDDLPEQKVFVRSFGGFASESDWVKNAKALGEALQRDGKKFDDSFFYSAGYDSPFRILNRHNEVWFEEATK